MEEGRMKICGRFLTVLAIALAAALIQPGCAVTVRTDFDHGADFSSYQTFDWLAPPQRESSAVESESRDPFSSNSLLDKRIRAAVERSLDARGYRRAVEADADIRLNYHVIFRDKLVASGTDFGFYNRYRYGGFGTGFDFSVRQYQEGTIIVDVVDRATDQLVWRGWAASRNNDGNYDEAEISYTIEKILEQFPPGR
jgi:hypothetical protein